MEELERVKEENKYLKDELTKIKEKVVLLTLKIDLYEISTKYDFEKIENLRDENEYYKKLYKDIYSK